MILMSLDDSHGCILVGSSWKCSAARESRVKWPLLDGAVMFAHSLADYVCN